MDNINVYQHIAKRTKGDIYIGVVGPVRTGKSTFIKSFMENLIIPQIEDVYLRERAIDELPQSGSGRTIMTSEPKFVPEEAVRITIDDAAYANVRLIDSVGYMVDGALGEFEGEKARMVTTPWFDNEVSLKEAAEMGTYKVISEHSTIGIVVTTDGTIGEISRDKYFEAEKRVVAELTKINKPFVIIVNTTRPESAECKSLCTQLESMYGVTVLAENCASLGKTDIDEILRRVLYEFPVSEMSFDFPEWVTTLSPEHEMRKSIYDTIWEKCSNIRKLRDVSQNMEQIAECQYVDQISVVHMGLSDGTVGVDIKLVKGLFFEIIREQTGMEIGGESELLNVLSDMAEVKCEYDRLQGALQQVRATGYGIVMPTQEEMSFCQPEIVRQGGKFGVKLKASAPSIHLIKADIETEISPIVGSEKQSEELVSYLLSEFEESPDKIWQSNIFGKSLSELVNEGLNNKLYRMPEDARGKLQQTLERIINEGAGGLICIII